MKLPKFTVNGKRDKTIQEEWEPTEDSNKKDKGKKHAKKKEKQDGASN
jgi:hypothetical protein